VRADVQKLCTDALDKLAKYKPNYFLHYQKFVEYQDGQKIDELHDQNWNICSIVCEFVTWYYKQDDLLSRVQKGLDCVG
jgi:hypothetical protein